MAGICEHLPGLEVWAMSEVTLKLSSPLQNLPYMPWERTILRCAKVSLDSSSGSIKLDEVKTVEGTMEEPTSISQPQWLGGGSSAIVALSDERGFNEPWIFRLQEDYSEPLLPAPPKRDFGFPSWQFNFSHWAVSTSGASSHVRTCLS